MSKKENKNKTNNNISLLNTQQYSLNSATTELFIIQCQYVDDYGGQGEWIEFDISQYLRIINYKLTAASLIDFLFSKLFNFDEKKIQIIYDDQNYVYLNQNDSQVSINFINNCIKLRLKRAELSIYHRFLKLEEENKMLKDQIQQIKIEQQNDLKMSLTNSKNEEEEEAVDENIIDLAILYSDPLVEMKRTIQPYQQSVSYQKEIQDLKKELQSISKQIKIKIANLTIDNLQKVCMHNKPTILHIICHGQIDNKDKYLHFENSDYSLQKVNPDDLRKILSHLEDKKPKLVFVNACNSAIVSDVFREAGVPFVVSVDQNHSILDEVAQNFSKYFYRNIIQYGKSIQELFLNAQEITDKVIQGTKNYPCCCLHEHKQDCQWFNGDDQNPNHEDHIFDCNCSKKQQQKHYNSCKEAKDFLQKYKPNMQQQQSEFQFTCCCYTYQELQEKNLLYHEECQKFKLDYDPKDDFFNKPLFKSKKNGKLVDLSDFCIDKISSTLFVRKVESYNVLKTLKDPNYKCITIAGKNRVGKSLFANKVIEYSQLRGLFRDMVQVIDVSTLLTLLKLFQLIIQKYQMKDIYYCEQIWSFFKKSSKKELIEQVENLDGLIYLKDCDKIFEKDDSNFKQLLQDLSRYTKKVKIILTLTKEYHSPFFTFYLRDYLAYDTRIFLNYLFLQENISIYRRKQLISDFLNNQKVQRTPFNIQAYAKYKNFNGLETNEDNLQQSLDELRKDPQLYNLVCIMSFFKNGLNEQDFNILYLSNYISKDWVEQCQKVILTIDNRQTNFKAYKFQDLYDVVKGKNIGITKGRLKFMNFNMRETIVEAASKNFESQRISLYLFQSVLTKKDRKSEWKMLKLIDFSCFTHNVEVFRDVIPKIKNPVIEADEKLELENLEKGQKVNWINETSFYIGSLLDKHILINDSLTSEQIEQIVQIVLSIFFQLVSIMKLNISKNALLKPICYWGQRFFQKYLQLAPEKKLLKENQIKKADIYLDLLLLDIEINEKNGHQQIKQHFENINFILKKLEGMDFQQVQTNTKTNNTTQFYQFCFILTYYRIESQLYQCKAYLLLLKHQNEILHGVENQIEMIKDKELILESLDKSDKCLSCDRYTENFVYKELNAAIKHKNTIFQIEHKIIFDKLSLTQEDKAAVHTIQQKYMKNKHYKNIQIIYETIMNHIQLQIYTNQIQLGKTDAFNSLNNHIEYKFPQLKDEENVYGVIRLKIYKALIQQYREECTKGLVYVMHSQPLIDFMCDSNHSLGSSCSSQKGQKQQFRYLDQPYYSIWQYNDILRSQVFQKCKKQIKYSFLSFNRKNYNTATRSGCQILSINSNFEEDSHLKTFQFEGSQLLEVDQYEKEENRVLEKIQQLQRVRILLLCINNSLAIQTLIKENIFEGQQQIHRAIIYFPFKENCKSFDKVLICQKFQLEFFKQYLNQNNKTIKESFDVAKEQTKNFILKRYDLKKEKNINFDKIFGDVPQIYSNPDSFLDQPLVLDEKDRPQEITPLIQHSNIKEQINMDKIILKSRDIYQIKHFFNEQEVRLVNLYSTSNATKIGKTTLALSFAMTLLERNLHFTGGIHFLQSKHSTLSGNQHQKNNISQNFHSSISVGGNVNDTNISFKSQTSNCISFANNSLSHGSHNISLKQTLENLNSIFKNRGYSNTSFTGNQMAFGAGNSYYNHSHPEPVLIILSGFDCFSPKQFEFLFERRFFPNFRFLNISNRKFSLNNQAYAKMFKNHEVMPYKNLLSRLVTNKIEEEEEIISHSSKKGDSHHQSGKNKKQGKQTKNSSQKYGSGNQSQHQGQSSSPFSLLEQPIKGTNSTIIQQQLSQIIPKTTPFLTSQKSNNKQSSKSFSSDNSTLQQAQSLNLNEIQINTMNSCDGFLLKGTISEIQKDFKENDDFFEDIDKDLKPDNREASIQSTPFSQQSSKRSQNSVTNFGSKLIGEFNDNQSYYEPIDNNFEEQDTMKNDIFDQDQSEALSEISESNNDYPVKSNKKNREFYGDRHENLNSTLTEKKIRKPRYSSSVEQNNIDSSSQGENTQFEPEAYQDDIERDEIEEHHTDD